MTAKRIWLITSIVLGVACIGFIILGSYHAVQATKDVSTAVEQRMPIIYFAVFGEMIFLGGGCGVLWFFSLKRYNSLS